MKTMLAELGAFLQVSALLALGGLAVGCKGSVQADAKASAQLSEEEVKDFDRPLEASSASAPAVGGEAAAPEGEYALLGARHDLGYAGPGAAVCRCLAVRVEERPDASSLHWDMAPPNIDKKRQWVVALSSKGVSCEGAPAGTLGASYQGYETDGDDVIVFVEALGEGRPMTNGAIIPRPPPDGGVYIEASGSIYGKPLSGDQKRCKVPTPAGTSASAEPKPTPVTNK